MKCRRLYQPSESMPGRTETGLQKTLHLIHTIRHGPIFLKPSGSLKNRTSGPWKSVARVCDSPHVLRIFITLCPKLTNVARWCLLLTDLCWTLVNWWERKREKTVEMRNTYIMRNTIFQYLFIRVSYKSVLIRNCFFFFFTQI